MGRIKFAALRPDIQAFEETGEPLPALHLRIATLNRDAKRKRDRYANDPEHRKKKIAAAKAWNRANPEKHRRSNGNKGAAAARRYRTRCKAVAA